MISFLLCLALLIIGYFVYGKIVDNTFGPDDRETPAVRINDGVDYVVMPQWKLFLVQLLNIAGLGPIFGALQGALWGPVVFLWITFGTIFAGGVHDYFSGMMSEGAEMVQEMKPYFTDFPNVKNNCLRFEVSPSIEESSSFTDADWAELGNDFMQRMGLMNHQYIIIRHSGTESKKEQAHLHILANRISLSGELYRDNWIGKRATEAANAIAKERNFVQSQDIGKANKAEIKEAMNEVLKKLQGFDLAKFQEELGKLGFKVREARASTGKLNGYYVTARSGTEYKASEIGKGYTLAHIERTQSRLKYNSMNISHGNKLTSGKGGFHL